MPRFILAALLAASSSIAAAELIDDFSASQGPFTVGPGEEISEHEGVLQTDSVLGGFRVLIPAIDEDAPAGSTVSAGVAGGEFFCDIDVLATSEESGGGCSTGYDRGNNALFDLSASQAFELEITSVTGDVAFSITLFGPDQTGSAIYVESPSTGTLSLPLSQFVPLTANPVDFAGVDNIGLTVISPETNAGSITIDRLGTSGPIGNGEAVPGDEPDDDPPADAELRDEIYGNFFNPQRSGEGIQLTLENDGETFVLTYYTYLDGEQVWLIGTGVLANGRIVFEGMSITEGGDYGGAFDPSAVDFIDWGTIEMRFLDCNNAVLEIEPDLGDFESFLVEMQRIIPAECGAGGPSFVDRIITGNWFDPNRSGEGFQLAYEEGRFVLTFYTYQDGKQVWLIGLGDRFGDTLVFPEMNVTRGADFGGRFDAGDVETEFFGAIEMTVEDCNNATIEIESALPGFEDLTVDASKIVPGSCVP